MKLGKQGKINAEANRKLKKEYMDRGYTGQGVCEARLEGCQRTFGVGYAHKHKRVYYYSRPELLSSYNETILACTNCHDIMEHDKNLTLAIFKEQRWKK